MRIKFSLKKFLTLLVFLVFTSANAQPLLKMQQPKDANFYEVQKYFDEYFKQFDTNEDQVFQKTEEEQDNSYKIYKRWEAFMEPRVFPSGKLDYEQQLYKQYELLKRQDVSTRSLTTNENWILVGPSSTIPLNGGAGRINGLTINPQNPQSIWAGAPSGGLWHSTDGGNSWTTNTDLHPILGVSEIAINPIDTMIMYISTGDGDAGTTYSIGLMKSIDGGLTWNLCGMNNSIAWYGATRKILIYPTDPSLIIVCTDNAIYRSHDSGTTWIQTQTDNFFDLEFNTGDSSILYAASTTKVYMSSDTGSTWTQLTDSLPTADVGRIALAVTPAAPNIIYAMCTDAATWGFYGLYRSVDGGATWDLMSNTPNLMGWDVNGGDAGGQGWYTLTVAAEGTDTVYVGGVDIWKSVDGGATWTCNAHWYGANGVPYVHADIHSLDFHNGILYTGCDGGVFQTSDGGTTWTDKSNGLQIAQYYRFSNSKTNPDILYAGAQDNGTARHNAGVWEQVTGGDGMEALVDFTDENVVYTTYQNGYLMRSANGGQNFSDITPPGAGAWVTPYIINPQDHNMLYYGGITVYRSINQGFNWWDMGGPGMAGTGLFNALALAPSDPNILLASRGNVLLKSIFGGGTWTNLTPNFPVAPNYISYIAFDNTDANHFWVSCSGWTPGVKVFETTDGGLNWDNVSQGLPNLPVNTIVHQDNSTGVLYIGTDLGIYYKNDYLSHWIPVNSALPNVIVDELEFQYSSGVLRAATFGRGVWQTDTVTMVNYALDAGVKRVENPPLYVCVDNLVPSVTVKNYGTTAITQMNVIYQIDNGISYTYNYSGSLASLATVTLDLDPVTILNAGQHQLTVYIQNPNGTNDDFMANDTMITLFNFVPQETVPVAEDYEIGVFPPHKWQVNNPDNNITWETTGTSAFGDGGFSMTMDNYWYNATGQLDNFVSPLLDFSEFETAEITWDLAYALYPGYTDSLFVKVSADCGETWTRIYANGDSTMTTAPDVAYPFAPDSTQWRTESVDLTAFAYMSDIMIEFQNWNGYGNYLYVDNINITGDTVILPHIVSLDETNQIHLFPDPVETVLHFDFHSVAVQTIELYNLLGEKMLETPVQNSLDVSYLSSGIYLICFTDAEMRSVTERFVKE